LVAHHGAIVIGQSRVDRSSLNRRSRFAAAGRVCWDDRLGGST
jgi:hypothetical protein